MAKQANVQGLHLALVEITRRALAGKPMALSMICKKSKLGMTTARKLQWALLKAERYVPCKDATIKRMHVKRDGETWVLNYKSATGARDWTGLNDEFDLICEEMAQCPPEIANPWYYKAKKEDVHVIGELSINEDGSVTREDPLAMSDLVYDDRTGDFVPRGQLNSPVAPEGKTYTCEGELVDVKKSLAYYSVEELCHELFSRGYQVDLHYMGVI